MSSLIQKVSFQENEVKTLAKKLTEHLGVHRLSIFLREGMMVSGVLSEVGKDYLVVLEGGEDKVVPLVNILYFSHES
ncbi:MAG: hypothetical protein OEY59_09550 [Deltaproteobacteria bacterium]|nr:hypothetical protein [Deltaproteobacteria bacterium]